MKLWSRVQSPSLQLLIVNIYSWAVNQKPIANEIWKAKFGICFCLKRFAWNIWAFSAKSESLDRLLPCSALNFNIFHGFQSISWQCRSGVVTIPAGLVKSIANRVDGWQVHHHIHHRQLSIIIISIIIIAIIAIMNIFIIIIIMFAVLVSIMKTSTRSGGSPSLFRTEYFW